MAGLLDSRTYNFHCCKKVGKKFLVEITEDIIIHMKRIWIIKAGYSANNIYNIDKTGFIIGVILYSEKVIIKKLYKRIRYLIRAFIT